MIVVVIARSVGRSGLRRFCSFSLDVNQIADADAVLVE